MRLVGDEIAGHPIRDERWVRRSLAKLQRALAKQGRRLSQNTIRRLLRTRGIRARSNVKHLTPKPHPDRDRQFRYLTRLRKLFVRRGDPVISVDAMETQKIGPFAQRGRAWNETPPEVYSVDFLLKDTVRAVPYGVYDPQANRGLICIGVSGNTPDFAVEAIRMWWRRAGTLRYRGAKKLLILADCGSSNGYRLHRWKLQLQRRLADPYGLAITVCHYPTGASKWNPIEHRLFCQINQTWAGLPLTSLDLLIAAIRATTTSTGLRVRATALRGPFLKGLRVTKEELATIRIRRHVICPNWNYTITPNKAGS